MLKNEEFSMLFFTQFQDKHIRINNSINYRLIFNLLRMERKIRIVMAKPGLDGHDRGIKVLASA